jgi:crossover junction endodeoxyribonuclease RuvC
MNKLLASDMDRTRATKAPDWYDALGAPIVPPPVPRLETVVLGLDPGLAALGWGVVRREGTRLVHVAHGCVTTKPGDLSDLERAVLLGGAVARLARDHGAAVVAHEAWRWYGPGSGQTAHQLGLVLGACGRALAEHGLGLTEAGRAQDVRVALGLGRAAPKGDLARRVARVLGLAAVPAPSHSSDALACAIVVASRCPQATHRNSAWVGRLAGSTTPQTAQVRGIRGRFNLKGEIR